MEPRDLKAQFYNDNFHGGREFLSLFRTKNPLCSHTVQQIYGFCSRSRRSSIAGDRGNGELETLTFFANKVPPHDPPPAGRYYVTGSAVKQLFLQGPLIHWAPRSEVLPKLEQEQALVLCESNDKFVLLMQLPDSLAAQQGLRKSASTFRVPGSVNHARCLARRSDDTLQVTPEMCLYTETGKSDVARSFSIFMCMTCLKGFPAWRSDWNVTILHCKDVANFFGLMNGAKCCEKDTYPSWTDTYNLNYSVTVHERQSICATLRGRQEKTGDGRGVSKGYENDLSYVQVL